MKRDTAEGLWEQLSLEGWVDGRLWVLGALHMSPETHGAPECATWESQLQVRTPPVLVKSEGQLAHRWII